MKIIVINIVGHKFFRTNAGKMAMKIDTFTFQEAEPGLDGDIICTAALSGDTMNDRMFLEECDIASGCKLRTLIRMKDKSFALTSRHPFDGLIQSLQDKGIVIEARLGIGYNAFVVEILDRTKILDPFDGMDIRDIDGPLLVRSGGGKIAAEAIRNGVVISPGILLWLASRDGADVQYLHDAVDTLE